jgi:hypothetical protein
MNNIGELVPNRGEECIKEAQSFSEKQSNIARKRWKVHEKNNEKSNEINKQVMPRGNANTTTTTTTPLTPKIETARSLASALPTGALAHSPSPQPSLELQLAQKQHLGIAPDKGMDYRAPPAKKSDNLLAPLPDQQQREARKKAGE